ncbi:MAG: hypothetical protein ABFS86_05920 [Planctomycetota bacterium]
MPRVAFQLESGGGHQAWFAPILVFDVTSGRATDLSRLLGERGATMMGPTAPSDMRFTKNGTLRFLGRCDASAKPHRHSWDTKSGELRCVEE